MTTSDTVHACPPDGSGVTPCCGRTPFELPPTDRMTADRDRVTCPAVPVAVPPTEQAALREQIAEAVREFPFDNYGLDDVAYLLDSEPDTQEWVPKLAAAVLAILPPPADRDAAEAERDSLGREADRLRKDWVDMRTRAERAEAERDAYGEQLDETAETIAARTVEINRLTDELRRVADEAQQQTDTETRDDSPVCGAEPPGDGRWGDCWCTRPPGHAGEHVCGEA